MYINANDINISINYYLQTAQVITVKTGKIYGMNTLNNFIKYKSIWITLLIIVLYYRDKHTIIAILLRLKYACKYLCILIIFCCFLDFFCDFFIFNDHITIKSILVIFAHIDKYNCYRVFKHFGKIENFIATNVRAIQTL